MDLTPADFRQSQWARRFVRGLSLITLWVVLLTAVAWGGLQFQNRQLKRDIAALRERDGSSQTQMAALNSLRQQQQQITGQLQALQQLNGSQRVTRLLLALDAAHQEGVWFSSVSLRSSAEGKGPDQESGPGASPKPGTSRLAEADPSHLAELSGHALDHQRLASFMQALEHQAGVRQLHLVDTRTQSVGERAGLDFALMVQLAPDKAKP